MLFSQTPFASANIDDGYTPSQSAKEWTSQMASPLRYAALMLPEDTHPIIGHYYYGPMESVQQRIVLSTTQNPGLLPSGTR